MYPFVAQISNFPTLPGHSRRLQAPACENITIQPNSTFQLNASATSSEHQIPLSRFESEVVQNKNPEPNCMASAFSESVTGMVASVSLNQNNRNLTPKISVEVRHSNVVEHERICAQTKTVYEK